MTGSFIMEETGIPRENHRNGSQFYWWRKQEYPEKTTEMTDISILFTQSVLLVEETGIPRENHRNGSQFYWWRKQEYPE